MKKPKVGDRVTCKVAVRCYYKGGPPFRPGMVGTVAAIAPKVRIVEGPAYDRRKDFLVIDYHNPETGEELRTSINYCNAEVVNDPEETV